MKLLVHIDHIAPHASGVFLVRYALGGLRRAALLDPATPGAADLRSGRWAFLTLHGGRITRAERARRAAA